MATELQAAPRTAGDYRSLPEDGPRYQLVEGELIIIPTPNRYHQIISRNLELIIAKYLERKPIAEMYHAPFDVYLDEYNVLQPDILVVSRERYPTLTDAGAEGAPDFVVEILSPSNANLDRERKRAIYARKGVIEFWIIDPDTRRISVYLLQENASKPSAVYDEGDVIESPLLPGLRINTRKVFKQLV